MRMRERFEVWLAGHGAQTAAKLHLSTSLWHGELLWLCWQAAEESLMREQSKFFPVNPMPLDKRKPRK